jgi:hypothetical protein
MLICFNNLWDTLVINYITVINQFLDYIFILYNETTFKLTAKSLEQSFWI